MLPLRLVSFWYPDALATFIRTYLHTIALLEEDLAVGLMWRLLFTPLFHDSSFVGRILSFFFRLTRVLVGLVAYLLASLVIVVLALSWFSLPILLFISRAGFLPKFLLLLGIAIFIERVLFNPRKKVWQIRVGKDIFLASKLKPSDINWSLTNSEEVKELLDSLELDPAGLDFPSLPLTDQVLDQVLSLAKGAGAKYATGGFFWTGMLLQIPAIDQRLLKYDLKSEDFITALNFLERRRNSARMINIWDEDFSIKHLKGVNRGWLGSPTPALDSVSTDLTKQATEQGFPDFIGREGVVSEVVTILSQEKDKNVLLVAQPGAGRTALVDFLAKLIVKGDAPKALAIKRLVSLDLSKLLSGVVGEGDLAQRIKEVFGEVGEDIIIFVDEIHALGMGDAGGSLNLFSLMQPYLESGKFQFIASTDPKNYQRILEKNSSLARIFNKIELPTASSDDTTKILQEKALDLEKNGLTITSRAIKEVVELSSRFIHDKVLPDSALSILSEAVVLTQGEMSKQKTVNVSIVKEVFGKKVNIPLDTQTDQKELLLNLESVIHQKMIDQEEAVKAVADTLRRSATSLRDSGRPIGSFLFVGPTGVGKTELAKTLAEVYFNQDPGNHNGAGSVTGQPHPAQAPFIRFDMSEYQTPEAVNRLLGDSNNPGELTEAVKDKPYCLILLDEFEKADPKILTLFLQVLDDGRLTDSSGETIDFTNTIIIATSNAASVSIAQELQSGQSMAVVKKTAQDELLKVFRPELVNRFDEIVVFKPLSEQDLEKVVSLKLESLKKLLKDGGYLVEFTPELVAQLGTRGFDPVLGARPLRRLIQDSLEAKLSRMILQNTIPKGEVFSVGVEMLS